MCDCSSDACNIIMFKQTHLGDVYYDHIDIPTTTAFQNTECVTLCFGEMGRSLFGFLPPTNCTGQDFQKNKF